MAQYPDTAVVEYSTWAVTYDTLYKDTPFGDGVDHCAPIEDHHRPGQPVHVGGIPRWLPGSQTSQVTPAIPRAPQLPLAPGVVFDPDLQSEPSAETVIYLPPSPDYTDNIVDMCSPDDRKIQNPVNGALGTKNATGGSANAIAFTANGRNYAAFGPPGTWWTWTLR